MFPFAPSLSIILIAKFIGIMLIGISQVSMDIPLLISASNYLGASSAYS